MQEKLHSAKTIVEEHFHGIDEHPLATKFARDRIQGAISSVAKTGTNLLSEFTSFEATPIWLETNKGLSPASVVLLRGDGDKVLLRVTLDWDEISFLAFVFTDLLRDEFDRAAKMTESMAIDIPHRTNISQRLEELTSAVADLRNMGTPLGIKHSGKTSPTIAKTDLNK